jgi:aromatic ring-cleaving dioxygenase
MDEKEFPPIRAELQQLYDDIERKEVQLRVWSGYETGIGKLSLLEENAEWIMVECAELNLSDEVCNRFKRWRETFREPSFDQQLFDTEGFELAKALKKSQGYGRIVEYQYPNFIQKIVSYHVRADYTVSLWNDTWCAIDLEWIEEDLGGYVIEDRKALQERFTRWEDWHSSQLTLDINREAFNQEGEALAAELRKRLPEYCVVYYAA